MTTTGTDRREIVEAATSYLDALVSHDSASVRFAPHARRHTNGHQTVSGADALREMIEREPVAAIGELRWVVDGSRAAVVYDLDADLTRSSQSDTFARQDTWIPTYVAECFTVVEGLITEIEVVYAATEIGRPRPPREERVPRATGPGAASRAQVIDIASAYLAALVSHDGSTVPLAPRAWRVENGRNSGDSGPDIAAALGHEIMHVVSGVRDAVWVVEDDTAIVFYTIDVDPTRLPNVPSDTPSSAKRLGERFRVVDGNVAEIEAVIPASDI